MAPLTHLFAPRYDVQVSCPIDGAHVETLLRSRRYTVIDDTLQSIAVSLWSMLRTGGIRGGVPTVALRADAVDTTIRIKLRSDHDAFDLADGLRAALHDPIRVRITPAHAAPTPR